MIIRRLIYIAALTGSALLYMLSPFWFSSYFVTVLLLIIPFDLLLSLPGMLSRSTLLSAPDILEQNADGILTLTTLQRRSFPVRHIIADLNENRNGLIQVKRLQCGAKRGSKYNVKIDTAHSGIIIYSLKQIRTISLTGLFTAPVIVNRKVSVLILPKPVRPPHIAALPRGVIFRPKPGGGFAEDYDLRQYRYGDPVRSIHWKLSAKLNTLTIREPLIPPPHSRFIHAMNWNGDRERDLVLGRLRWISDYLLKWDLPFYVMLGDDNPVVEITKNADLISYIRCVLEDIPYSLTASDAKPAHFTWVFRINGKDGEKQ